MTTLNKQLVHDMVTDWLSTPVNGYLGSDYGQDLKRLLHSPLSQQLGDAQLAKLKEDVQALAMLPDSTVNLYKIDQAPDTIKLFIELAGQALPFKG